jgi:predicted CXXCH cytochrome family protein
VALVAVLASAAVVCIFARVPGGRRVFQAGPVAPAHTLFQDDCRQCHVEAFRVVQRFSPSCAQHPSVADTTCSRCHPATLHHPAQATSPACVACHREHRGAAQLATPTDGHCTSCHASIHHASLDPERITAPDVTAFPIAHPEIGLYRDGQTPRDEARLHFNHQKHLQLENVACSDCHVADDSGRLMRPIRYEAHCSRCHPLSVRLDADVASASLRMMIERFAAQPAPHREPETVRATLRERLVELLQDDLIELPAPGNTPPPFIRSIDPSASPGPQPPRIRDAHRLIDEQLARTEALLFDRGGGCSLCHVSAADNPRRSRPQALPVYEPTHVPARWLQHARFAHHPHRMLDCTACHAAPSSSHTTDVLMPRMDVCASCHNPQAGARHDCVGCHQYHPAARD